MRHTARAIAVLALFACSDLAAAEPAEIDPPEHETTSQAVPAAPPNAPPAVVELPAESPLPPPPAQGGDAPAFPRLPRFALRPLAGFGVAPAGPDKAAFGLALGAVFEWWPEPWEPPPEGRSATAWMTSWSFGLTLHRNTFTHYINGAPPPGVSLTSMVWEPSVDVGIGYYRNRNGSGVYRIRLGAAAYVGTATSTDSSVQRLSTNATGGAIRFSLGGIFWAESPVGLAVDFILEGGWLGKSAVGSFQLLVGPSFHIWRQ